MSFILDAIQKTEKKIEETSRGDDKIIRDAGLPLSSVSPKNRKKITKPLLFIAAGLFLAVIFKTFFVKDTFVVPENIGGTLTEKEAAPASSDSEKVSRKVKPPRDFGKIDKADGIDLKTSEKFITKAKVLPVWEPNLSVSVEQTPDQKTKPEKPLVSEVSESPLLNKPPVPVAVKSPASVIETSPLAMPNGIVTSSQDPTAVKTAVFPLPKKVSPLEKALVTSKSKDLEDSSSIKKTAEVPVTAVVPPRRSRSVKGRAAGQKDNIAAARKNLPLAAAPTPSKPVPEVLEKESAPLASSPAGPLVPAVPAVKDVNLQPPKLVSEKIPAIKPPQSSMAKAEKQDVAVIKNLPLAAAPMPSKPVPDVLEKESAPLAGLPAEPLIPAVPAVKDVNLLPPKLVTEKAPAIKPPQSSMDKAEKQDVAVIKNLPLAAAPTPSKPGPEVLEKKNSPLASSPVTPVTPIVSTTSTVKDVNLLSPEIISQNSLLSQQNQESESDFVENTDKVQTDLKTAGKNTLPGFNEAMLEGLDSTQDENKLIDESSQETVPVKPVFAEEDIVEPVKSMQIKKPVEQKSPPIPFIFQLSDEVQESIPEIHISFHSYSEKPSGRIVSINGNVMREGMEMDGGVKIEQITSKGVVFLMNSQKFKIEL